MKTTDKPIMLEQPPATDCPRCGGDGWIQDSMGDNNCETCNGTGKVKPATDTASPRLRSAGDKQWTRETVFGIWNTLHYDEDFKPTTRFVDKIIDAHNAALAAEREISKEWYDRWGDTNAALLQAQAAIAEIYNMSGNDSIKMMIRVKEICHSVDLSALDKHDEEVRKPLVDLLRESQERLGRTAFPSLWKRIDDALPKSRNPEP